MFPKNRRILYFLEKCYIHGFNFIKKISKPKLTPFRVISVGNISTGGTGKSVLVKFLTDQLPNGAIVSRGYKGNNEKTGNSLLVSDDCSVDDVGDEAFMLSKSNTPVVVGSNRYKSINLLGNLFKDRSFKDKSLKYVVLDDAYQNFKIVKDLDVVLLNACNPFDNGHCLPAGRLREKDLSRADIIILTHSDMVDLQYLSALRASLSGLQCPILLGRHKVKNLLDKNLQVADDVLGEEFLAFAGLGSFQSFIKTLNNFGLKVVDTIEFKDHHRYEAKDISLIKKRAKNRRIVTTMKDWYKIKPFIKHLSSIYVLDITFDFLVSSDKEIFWEIVNKGIK